MFWLHWYTMIWAHFWRREVWPKGEVKVPEPGTLQSEELSFWPLTHACLPLCGLERNSSASLSHKWGKPLTHNLRGTHAGTRLEHTYLANIVSFLDSPDSWGKLASSTNCLGQINCLTQIRRTNSYLKRNKLWTHTKILIFVTTEEWD